MKLKYTTKAKGQLKRLPAHVQDGVLSVIEHVKQEPLFAGDRLRGSRTMYRAKVTRYRIIYRWSGRSITIIEITLRTGHTYHRMNPSPHITN